MAIEVRTLTAGNMWKVLVKPGDRIKAGDTLFVMEVMKMEIPHEAPVDGMVKTVRVEEGQEGLEADTLAIEIE